VEGRSECRIDLLYYWNYTSPATSSTTNNGNLTNLQVNTQALGMLASNYYQTYGYDNVNRVTTAGDNGGYGWSQNFGYDQFGNMWLSSFAGIVTPNLTPSLQSKINAATNHVSLASGTAYDPSGNLTTFGSSTLSYDTNNMMIGVAGSATYAYDGLGQRVSKVYGGVTTVYAYDAFGNPTAEYSSAAASLPVCATCYLSWDQLGSSRLVTDQNATPVARHDFLPFGGEIIGAYASRPSLWGTTDYVDPKFTGQFRDTESGLDFFNARYHAQAMGRLLSADPGQAGADATNPQSWNGYTYTLNSPLAIIDPSGLDSFDAGDTGDPCIDDAFLCGDGGNAPDWPTQPAPPPPPPFPPIVASSGVPNTTGVYGQGQQFADSDDDIGRPLIFDARLGILTVYIYDPITKARRIRNRFSFMTGENGDTDPTHPNTGPLPPGRYNIFPGELKVGGFVMLHIDPRDWGNFRVALNPNPGTNTFGRSGFFLHGGHLRPGSEGCIKVGGPNQDQLISIIKSQSCAITLTMGRP
jgi:RHS repeat-associated protein